jgi:hypothetical protein
MIAKLITATELLDGAPILVDDDSRGGFLAIIVAIHHAVAIVIGAAERNHLEDNLGGLVFRDLAEVALGIGAHPLAIICPILDPVPFIGHDSAGTAVALADELRQTIHGTSNFQAHKAPRHRMR